MTKQEYKQRELYYNGYKFAVSDYCLWGDRCCLSMIQSLDREKIKEGVTFERGYVDGYNYMRGEQNEDD